MGLTGVNLSDGECVNENNKIIFLWFCIILSNIVSRLVDVRGNVLGMRALTVVEGSKIYCSFSLFSYSKVMKCCAF